MKTSRLIAICLCLVVTTASAQDLREYTSSDGAQKLSAKFVRYDTKRDRVTLRLSSGKNLVTGGDKFSKEDQEFFVTQQRAIDLERSIEVDTDSKSDREKIVRGQLTYKTKTMDMSFKVLNKSDSVFESLTVEYWVVVEYDGKERDESIKTFNKSYTISSLDSRSEHIVEGPSIKLTLGADPGCATCPKIIAAAAAVGRDRLIGSKVVVRNAAGKEVFSDTSSNRIRTMLAKAE